MSEEHYDIIMEHFADTFKLLDVDAETIAQAKIHLLPLRAYFIRGAQEQKARVNAQVQRQRLWVVATAAVVVGIAMYATRRKK
jgi:hypothetical protein